MAVRFEWDEAKAQANLRKHGLDFTSCETVFEGYTVTAEDTRTEYGERRFVTLGLLEGRVVSVVHTETARTIRIISIRKATRHEQEAYFNGFPH
jgi:uncharacterized DUF497 family protein